MAKLDVNRMLNSTKLNKTDDAHRELEADLESILGAPDNTDIEASIFGENPEVPDDPPIQPDGSIRGVPVFRSSSPPVGAGNALGLEWDDGTELRRLVFEQGKLRVFSSDDDGVTWTQVSNLEDPNSASGLFINLTDVDISSLTANKILQVNAGGTEIEQVDPAAVGGIADFVDLGDTPVDALSAHVGKLVYVASGSSLGYIAAPAGTGNPFAFAMRADSTSDWGDGDWIQTYNWVHDDDIDDGGQLTETGIIETQTGPTVKAGAYMYLPIGIYDVAMWYSGFDLEDKYGSRGFRVRPATGTPQTHAAGTGDGLAYDGIEQRAQAAFTRDVDYNSMTGIKYMGSGKLIVTSAGTFEIQVKQTNEQTISNVSFYALVSQVK